MIVALAYFVSGRLGLAIPYVDSHITLIWLPTGIAVAALMRWGYIYWPGIFLGALATNYSVDSTPLLDSCIALGDTLAPLLAARLLCRLEFHDALDRAYDILLLVVAAAIGMLVSASVGVGSLAIYKVMTLQQAGSAWLSWWAGDFIGVLMAAPLLLNISGAELKKLWAQRMEFLVWSSIMLAVTWSVFFLNNDASSHSLPLVFMVLPVVVWAAMRFSVMGSLLGVLLPMVIAAVATSLGLGPFYTADVQQGLFLLWLFLAALVLVDLMVAALQAGRKRVEVALQQSEARFRQMFERHSSIMLLIEPVSGAIVDANAAASRFYGYPPERLMSMNIAQINTKPPNEVAAERAQAMREERNYFIFPHRLASGEMRTVEVHTSSAEVAGHTLLFSIIHDITERNKAELATREAKERIEIIFNTSPDAVLISRLSDGYITDVNNTFINLSGHTKEESIGNTTLGLNLWMNQDDRQKFIHELQTTGFRENFEAQFRKKDGSQHTGILSAGITTIQGVPHIVSTTRDITEYKRAEELLRESEARTKLILDVVMDAVISADQDGLVVGWNREAERMFGYAANQVLGRDLSELIVPPAYRKAHQQGMRRFVETGKSTIIGKRIEITGMRADGSEFPVELTLVAVLRQGRYFFNAFIRDITGRKASDAKIQRLINLYAALSQCNQAIVRCTSEDELFQQVCRDAVQFGSMKMAWIGLVDEASHMVKLVACYGTGTEYLDEIQISVNSDEPSGRGTTGMAIREDRPVWIQDFQNEQHLAPWHERGARYGWASVAALPLHRNGVVIGALVLYAAVTDAFDEAARNLLEGMATDISYALTQFALLAERKKTEDAMRIAAVTFETQEAILITDPDAKILRVNQAFQDITGYSAAEVIGQNPRILQSGRHDGVFFQAMWSELLDTGKWTGEIWDRRKNGEIYPKLMTITAVYDDLQRVTHYVAVFRDISNRKKSEQAIHQLAFYDSLTLLPNRRLLLDRLQQALAVSARNGRHGALLFLDMDHFKTINDTQGHAMGDQLLIEVARRLRICVRESDSVERLGGDEFVVVLEELSSEADEAATQAELVAEKIRSELGQSYLLKDYECLSTVSVGISLFSGHPESAEDLLKHADVAMYQAKTAGRNAIRFFDPDMQTALEVRAAMEADLRHALEKQQFHLSYQIQVDSLRRPLGAEVLLRWDHPERGRVSPMQFIPLAEETGLIVPVGLWVLKTACTQLKEWQNDARTRDLILAVNVSAKQFRQPDFVAQAQRILLESGTKPSHLKLELTESTVLENVEDTISKMRELKILGVGFSMDDFGTGYSSLQYLKRLPLDQIKIDQSFVRDIATDPNDAAIVQTIIAMTEALGLNVIAEGVETMAQFEFLDNHGCHAFQGFLFSKPVPLEQFESALRGEWK